MKMSKALRVDLAFSFLTLGPACLFFLWAYCFAAKPIVLEDRISDLASTITSSSAALLALQLTIMSMLVNVWRSKEMRAYVENGRFRTWLVVSTIALIAHLILLLCGLAMFAVDKQNILPTLGIAALMWSMWSFFLSSIPIIVLHIMRVPKKDS